VDGIIGFFVGRSTFDIAYVCDGYPVEDTKVTAQHRYAMAGGPALNAAVAFAMLGGCATLWSAVGSGPIAQAVKEDLHQCKVDLRDVAGEAQDVLPVSSIIVNSRNATRTILNDTRGNQTESVSSIKPAIGETPQIALMDGFLPHVVRAIARPLTDAHVPIVLDGGSWKAHSAELLPFVSIAIVSERFRPPGTRSTHEVLDYLASKGITRVAISRGANPIMWRSGESCGELLPPKVHAIDTLGAGDILHGAFCFYYARTSDFVESLRLAMLVASHSTTVWGTRSWLSGLDPALRS
jgi:sugar/nucleoside kinase (ribokinase family)